MGKILIEADELDKVVATVCHGPGALLSAVRPAGTWLYAGRRLTAFSDAEEIEFGTAENAPWLLASRLEENGAILDNGANWESNLVRDGNLISGQNPASSAAVADAVLADLG